MEVLPMMFDVDVLLREFHRHPMAELATDDLAHQDTETLIAYVLQRYHAVHRREFPHAIRLARKVEAVHAGHPDCPRGLADHLAFMADDLEAHQQKEEIVLFPLLARGGGPLVRFPIQKMTSEHRDVDDQLSVLASLTRDFTLPPGCCSTWRELYEATRKLASDLQAHMKLEEEVLFRRFAD